MTFWLLVGANNFASASAFKLYARVVCPYMLVQRVYSASDDGYMRNNFKTLRDI